MKKCVSFCFIVILSVVSSVFALDESDCKAINQIVDHFTNAWNYHEGHGSADFYAQDADFVNIFGMAFAGKEEIETRHIQIHESFLKGTIFEVIELKLREATQDVVIAHVYWKVTHTQNSGKDPQPTKGIFTHVFLKNQDKWEITATQNTLITN